MSVEDTDFSPPATAVMFLLTIHPSTLEAGDFLSTGVKNRYQNVPAQITASKKMNIHAPAGAFSVIQDINWLR